MNLELLLPRRVRLLRRIERKFGSRARMYAARLNDRALGYAAGYMDVGVDWEEAVSRGVDTDLRGGDEQGERGETVAAGR
jgi:hypothetical protein